MSNKNELLARFSELEKEIKENGEKQSAIKKTFAPQIAKLEKDLAAKEEEKNALASKKPMFGFTKAGNSLVFNVFLPAMLFVNVYDIESVSSINWGAIVFSVVAVCALTVIGVAVAILFSKVPDIEPIEAVVFEPDA